MASKMQRGLAAGGTVVFAGAINIATGMLTQRWDMAWLPAVLVLVLVGGALQAWLTFKDQPSSAPSSSQTVTETEVGGSVEQDGADNQSVSKSRIDKNLRQRRRGR